MGKTATPDPDDELEEDAPVGGGTFTQDQVNTIVRDRLARQKSQLERKFAAVSEELTQLKAEVEPLKAFKATADERSKAALEEKRKGLPEPVLKLLEKMEPSDQLAWIDENATALLEKVPAPQTPPKTPPETPKPKEPTAAAPDLTAKTSKSGLYYGI